MKSTVFPVFVILCIVLLSGTASAFSFWENLTLWFSGNESSPSLPVEPVDIDKIILLVNQNPSAVNYIQKSGVQSLTVKTETREIDLALNDTLLATSDQHGVYTVRASEDDLRELLEKYEGGDRIVWDDITSTFDVPAGLYWRVVLNIWG